MAITAHEDWVNKFNAWLKANQQHQLQGHPTVGHQRGLGHLDEPEDLHARCVEAQAGALRRLEHSDQHAHWPTADRKRGLQRHRHRHQQLLSRLPARSTVTPPTALRWMCHRP